VATEIGVANAPGPKTEAGMRCLLGFGPWMCETVFDNFWARGAIESCGGNPIGVNFCWSIESIEYRGTNAAGEDVYSVKFTNTFVTYVLPQPGPDGKIATRCKFDGAPGVAAVGVCLGGRSANPSKMTVTSPVAQILYTRPAEDSRGTPVVSSDAAAKAVVMANTPTGAGDPSAVVCRAPQPIAGNGQLGSKVCLRNYDWWKVAMNGKDIAPDGKSLIDRPTVNNPRGEGDPDAITCRTPQFVWSGPPVKICRLNSFWADVIKNHEMVDARGNVAPRVWNTDYGPAYGPGGYPYGDPRHDSGNASQSSATQGTP